ncbi:MAG: TIGR00730 family Rossman fold protein [Muribaculaceae bacterium]|nr:TIGR00730 family Rossman fold protein [Muribaculaceae bacterium]
MQSIDKGITIYCGSAAGSDPRYIEAARTVGAEVARKGLPLIYGGGSMGLMGAAGDAARAAGGRTVAVIPQFMVDRGWNDPAATVTEVTTGMHPRKQLMAHMARGVIALPGGIGTLEELCEIITWRQLGLYDGNIVILNVAHYYDSFLAQIGDAIAAGFLPADHRSLFQVTANPAVAVALAAAEPCRPVMSEKLKVKGNN